MSKALDPAKVQYMAGHLDPATTDHYRKRVSKVEGVDLDKWNELYGLAKWLNYVNRTKPYHFF